MKRSALTPQLGETWRQAIRDNLAAMADHLESVEQPLPARVKFVRSNLKRSLSLLRLAPDRLQHEAQRDGEQIRSIRRNLREACDSQALSESLGGLRPGRSRKHHSADLALLAAWRSILGAHQSATTKSITESWLRTQASRLRRLASTMPCAKSIKDADIVDRFRADYRRARRRRSAVQDGGPRKLHRLRQAVVDHRFQLELVFPRARDALPELEKLRRALGAYQDLEMLRNAVRDTPDGPDPGRLLKLIRRRQRRRLRRAGKLTRRLFGTATRRMWPSAMGIRWGPDAVRSSLP